MGQAYVPKGGQRIACKQYAHNQRPMAKIIILIKTGSPYEQGQAHRAGCKEARARRKHGAKGFPPPQGAHGQHQARRPDQPYSLAQKIDHPRQRNRCCNGYHRQWQRPFHRQLQAPHGQARQPVKGQCQQQKPDYDHTKTSVFFCKLT